MLIIPRGQRISQVIDSSINDITIILEPSSSATITLSSDPSVRDVSIQRNIHCIIREHASLILHYDEAWHETITANTDILVEQKQSSMVYYTHSAQGGAQICQQFSLKALEPDTHAD